MREGRCNIYLAECKILKLSGDVSAGGIKIEDVVVRNMKSEKIH